MMNKYRILFRDGSGIKYNIKYNISPFCPLHLITAETINPIIGPINEYRNMINSICNDTSYIVEGYY